MQRESTEKSSITSREMRSLELNAEYFGIPRILLMENAGQSVAYEIASRFKTPKSVSVFCGLGGNGGDGFVAARHLSSLGFKVTIVLAGRSTDIADKSAQENWKSISFLNNISIVEAYDSTLVPDLKADIVVDALLGTGSHGKLRPPLLQLVTEINSMKAFKIAVDVPTGVDSDTGQVSDQAVKADITVTFYRAKKGFEKAKKYTGQVIVKDIGLPETLEKLAGPGDVLKVVKNRSPDSHKGDFGRLLVIGGSEVYSGAPTLVALGAMRTGVDLVYVAAPAKTANVIASLSPDLITVKLDGDHLNPGNTAALEDYVERVDAVAIGPGLGMHRETVKAVENIVRLVEDSRKPLLLDADGLKAFAGFARKLKVPLVLTPHAGEYAILTGRKLPAELDGKISYVSETAKSFGAVVLLKGAVDVIADGKRLKLNLTGNPGMTVGGTGDVLSGIVAALMAQKTDAFEAAVAGAFVNGAAGDFVCAEKGYHMVATDVVDWIPTVLNDPMSHLRVRNPDAETD